jgi:hypothetical protein
MTMLAVSEPFPKSCGIAAQCPTVLTFAAAEMDALAALAESVFSWVRSVFLNAIFWLGTLERSTPSNLEASMLIWVILAIAESSRLLGADRGDEGRGVLLLLSQLERRAGAAPGSRLPQESVRGADVATRPVRNLPKIFRNLDKSAETA